MPEPNDQLLSFSSGRRANRATGESGTWGTSGRSKDRVRILRNAEMLTYIRAGLFKIGKQKGAGAYLFPEHTSPYHKECIASFNEYVRNKRAYVRCAACVRESVLVTPALSAATTLSHTAL